MGDWAMQGATAAFEPGGVGYGGVETRRHPQQDRCALQAKAMVGAESATEICWMNVRQPLSVCHC
jgi:hypothetical protein